MSIWRAGRLFALVGAALLVVAPARGHEPAATRSPPPKVWAPARGAGLPAPPPPPPPLSPVRLRDLLPVVGVRLALTSGGPGLGPALAGGLAPGLAPLRPQPSLQVQVQWHLGQLRPPFAGRPDLLDPYELSWLPPDPVRDARLQD